MPHIEQVRTTSIGLSQAAFARQVGEKKDRWAVLIRKAGIKPE